MDWWPFEDYGGGRKESRDACIAPSTMKLIFLKL
ncbi:hypothetical protein SOVF_106980 isoform B [Spinacia oleracea]|nr:hypothetical protein SOVF_106980 isoform B [Spinacia oleracea]